MDQASRNQLITQTENYLKAVARQCDSMMLLKLNCSGLFELNIVSVIFLDTFYFICRSNTSILGQKKKNAKKNESKRRALTRRLSEGESTDNEDKVVIQ